MKGSLLAGIMKSWLFFFFKLTQDKQKILNSKKLLQKKEVVEESGNLDVTILMGKS